MILFKTEQLKTQFEQLDDRLIHIAYALSGFCKQTMGKDFTVTSCFRDEINSTHKYWRAIDIRVKQGSNDSLFDFQELKNIEKFLDHFIYDENRPLLKSYLIHANRNDGGLHLHLQVAPTTFTKLVVT